MIGSLSGVIQLFNKSQILLQTQSGVGYLVAVPQHLLLTLKKGDTIHVYTYMHIREDLQELYGFTEYEDLQLFEKLLEVNGIGPKTALGIFTVGNRSDILSAITRADTKFFTGVPRLGTKNAQKLIIELKGKLTNLSDLTPAKSVASDEVTQALKGFGFKDKEIAEALEAIGNDDMESSKKIKLALKYLGK